MPGVKEIFELSIILVQKIAINGSFLWRNSAIFGLFDRFFRKMLQNINNNLENQI